ncbi:hypothetical protein FSW04_00515 [Baekduia soli]|uniref:Uncharacterized protein n=1 Tax=Baekduia soli TaxID=496014 RepID=A0A5B8TZQ0_9ACTN|nr:hypothetical protein [Baekduia soli]QEC46199.1 hypothetical protein FSW04_00515 [Baekduia soli]
MPSDVELYQRTYTTLLRSRGETKLRILEPSHRAMGSSLHPLAASDELDLGAFLYATQRLPARIYAGRVVIMGQEAEQFAVAGIDYTPWPTVESPARRRRWHEGPDGQWVVLLSSTSDVDDLIPTLVAYQLEWNKLRRRLRAIGWPRPQGLPGSAECARALGGSPEDWDRLQEAWGTAFARRLGEVAEINLSLRVRMLGGSQVSYARMTRRWWAPVARRMEDDGLAAAPVYFVSSNTHSLVNLLSGDARARERELVEWVQRAGPKDLQEELAAFREERTAGSWDNFLYFVARDHATVDPGAQTPRRDAEDDVGIVHLGSHTALRVAAQIMPLARLDPARLDPRLGEVDPDALRASGAVIVNVDYPLGLAAYNILREITEDRDTLRGVYVLGKAATLNADVGDVMISSTVFDEHSGTTYWLDNAFGFDDIAPYLRFGSGLDNQRAVTVRSTFLQNRDYLDLYYREAYTVVEMEAGPYCDAVYELSEADRYPSDGQVNMSKLPVDFGVVHYASDTPFTQARTLGARGMSYYGMDSTYATSIAILRRIFTQAGALQQ